MPGQEKTREKTEGRCHKTGAVKKAEGLMLIARADHEQDQTRLGNQST